MSALFPVLKSGKTLACFHRSGNIPVEILVLIILHRWRAKTGVAMLIYLALITSILVALFMFSDIRELTICSSVIAGIPNFTLFGNLLPTNSVRAAGGLYSVASVRFVCACSISFATSVKKWFRIKVKVQHKHDTKCQGLHHNYNNNNNNNNNNN